MQASIAVKLAEHLGHIAAQARVKRALDAYTQKQAAGNSDFLYGGGGGALLGALAGGGGTAVANLFRKKQDRKSVLNNALMGGLGGGALGLGATSIYKALNDPAKIPPKDVNDIIAEIRKKDDNAYKDAEKILNEAGDNVALAKLISSPLLAAGGYGVGSRMDTSRALDNAYRNDPEFRATIDKHVGSTDMGQRHKLFDEIAAKRSNLKDKTYSAPQSAPSPKANRANVRAGATAAPPEQITAAQLRRDAYAASVNAGKGRPMMGRIAGTAGGLVLPYAVDSLLRMIGVTPTQVFTGEDQFRRRDGLTQYRAEQMAAQAARGQ